MKRIPLRARDGSVRAYAIVDDEDFDSLTTRRWKLTATGYAQREEQRDGRWRSIRMHRVLLGLEHGDPLEGDHINGDRLDNRRSNLRTCTRQEQAQNVRRANPHGHPRGVTRMKNGRYVAQGGQYGRPWHLGCFATVEEAAAAALAFRQREMPFAVD